MSKRPAPSSDAPAPGSHAFTREVWLDRIARFATSGLTAAQFCATEDVSLPSFYAWRRRLARESAPDPLPRPRLLPVRLPHQAPLEVLLPSGLVLRLGPGCDLALVQAVLLALGGSSC